MNSKVANLIALELGVLIAILSWLAFSNFRSVSPPRGVHESARTGDAFATVAPVFKPESPRRAGLDYPADPAAELPLESDFAETEPDYEQAIATGGYDNYAPDGIYFDESDPYYAGVVPEPVLGASDCLFAPVSQFVVFRQPSRIVVFSNPRSSGRHLRPRDRNRGGQMPGAHRPPRMQPPRPQTPRARAPRVAPRPELQVQSSRSNPRTRTRDRR